jgi:WhiB family redox-sensing transcriptional regulator
MGSLPDRVALDIRPVHDEWEWQYQGACRNADPELFFLETGLRGPTKRKKENAALAVCNKCPVISQCREWALRVPEIYGVWGGTTADQRLRMLNKKTRR